MLVPEMVKRKRRQAEKPQKEGGVATYGMSNISCQYSTTPPLPLSMFLSVYALRILRTNAFVAIETVFGRGCPFPFGLQFV